MPSMPPPLLTTIGPYAVQGLLGQGGIATVYRAVDPTLQRPVALKLLSPSAAAMPGYADRFRQEARILAQLRHPNIVQVYDLGEHEGAPYMVQELLPGSTLEQRLHDLAAQERRLPADEVIAIIGQLAAALDAAHALGIIHRDVKPANAIWNAAGSLVLTDFGIAKQTLGDAMQTQAGLVIGTPAYLSPEQAQGRALTPASDVYALGARSTNSWRAWFRSPATRRCGSRSITSSRRHPTCRQPAPTCRWLSPR